MTQLTRLDDKDPAAVIVVTFRLAALVASGENITAATVVAESSSDDDQDPSAILSGEPQIQNNTDVLQKIVGGVDGVDYELKVTFQMSDTMTDVEAAILPVRTL